MKVDEDLTPVPMGKHALVELLEDIRHGVQDDDAWEGYIKWGMPGPSDPPGSRFVVEACFRVSEGLGSGGRRVIGTVVADTEPVTTSGGVAVTDELIERLSVEAETGYDVAQLTPRATDGG